MRLGIRLNGKVAYRWLLLLALFYDSIFYLVIEVIKKLPFIGLMGEYITPVVVLFLVYVCLRERSFNRIKSFDLLVVLIYLGLTFGSWILFPQNEPYIMKHYFPVLMRISIPMYFLGTHFAEKTDVELKRYLYLFAKMAVVIGVVYIYYTINFGNAEIIGDDNMALAYAYLPAVMFTFIGAMEKPKLFNWAIFAVGLILEFSFGTRGPIVVVLLFVMLMILMNISRQNAKRVLLLVSGIVLLIIILLIYFEYIMLGIRNLVESFGMSTRIFDRLTSLETLFASGSRDKIRFMLIEEIKKQPLLGYGMAGEWELVGWSAHNLYIGTLHNFGVIVGGVLLIWLMHSAWRAFFGTDDPFIKCVVLMYVLLTMVRGVWGALIIDPEVLFLLGMASRFGSKRQRRDRLAVNKEWRV